MNPEGHGSRYWDGTQWTHKFRPGRDDDVARPNEHAVGLAALFGAIAFIFLLIVLNPHIGGTSGYGAGQLFVPAAAVAALVGLVARGSARRLGWWVYALTIPAGALLLGLLLLARDG